MKIILILFLTSIMTVSYGYGRYYTVDGGNIKCYEARSGNGLSCVDRKSDNFMSAYVRDIIVGDRLARERHTEKLHKELMLQLKEINNALKKISISLEKDTK